MKTSSSQDTQYKILPLVAMAGASALAATNANATIISQTGLNQNISPGDTLSDIGGMIGLTIDFSTFVGPGPGDDDIGIYRAFLLGPLPLSPTEGVSSPIAAGTVVGPLGVFEAEVELGALNNVKAEGIFGVAFNNGDGTQYGWIDISVIAGNFGFPDFAATTADSGPTSLFSLDGGPNPHVILNGWGYENEVGKSIQAGATEVDEPATLALLALGAAGLATLRRRRSKNIQNA